MIIWRSRRLVEYVLIGVVLHALMMLVMTRLLLPMVIVFHLLCCGMRIGDGFMMLFGRYPSFCLVNDLFWIPASYCIGCGVLVVGADGIRGRIGTGFDFIMVCKGRR